MKNKEVKKNNIKLDVKGKMKKLNFVKWVLYFLKKMHENVVNVIKKITYKNKYVKIKVCCEGNIYLWNQIIKNNIQ